jgi:hypothetical protein
VVTAWPDGATSSRRHDRGLARRHPTGKTDLFFEGKHGAEI